MKRKTKYNVDYFDTCGKLRTVPVETNDLHLIPFIINERVERRKDKVEKIYRVTPVEDPDR